MVSQSIKRKILGIAVGLIVLMAVTSVLSTVIARKVAHQLDELSSKYVEAYGHLARMNVHSLEQALALRRMVIAKMQSPPDEAAFAERQKEYEADRVEIGKDADLTAFDLSSIETQPNFDVVSQLVYAAGREHVTDVWVRGEHVVRKRQVAAGVGQSEEDSVGARVAAWQNRCRHVLQTAGMT